MSARVTISYTRDQVLALGLLVCRCGHPPNNHFGHVGLDKQPCAHCDCKEYREIAKGGGRILKVMKQPSPPDGAPRFIEGIAPEKLGRE